MMNNILTFNTQLYISILLVVFSSCSKNEDCSQYDQSNFQQLGNENQLTAHSHNDYLQACPLTKALNLGFTSIEVDIFPFEGSIRVSHEDDVLISKPTIQSLYLDPLQEIFKNTDQQINLLVDLKVYNDDFLNQLHSVLENYDDILMTRTNTTKNVKIILSGNLPREEIIQNEKWSYFFIDGRLADLGKDMDSKMMPLISANFSDIFDFRPSQVLSVGELEQLNAIIQQTHNEGKIIRFWNTSDNGVMWSQLTELGVDVIGVDKLDKYYKFISNN